MWTMITFCPLFLLHTFLHLYVHQFLSCPFVRIRIYWDRSVTFEECWRFVFLVFWHTRPAALVLSAHLSQRLLGDQNPDHPPSVHVCVCPRLARLPSHTITWFLSLCRHLCHCGCVTFQWDTSNLQAVLISDTQRAWAAAMYLRGGDLNPTYSILNVSTHTCHSRC